MSYTLAYSFPAEPGLAIEPQLVNPDDTPAEGLAIVQSFADGSWYGVTAQLPGRFRGFLKFRAGGVTVAMFAVNPQEAEFNDVPASAPGSGGGSVPTTLTVRSTQHQPVPGVSVWLTTDEQGHNVVSGPLLTDMLGVAVFLLDPGTYWIWRRHPTVVFDNPKRLDVTDA